MSDTEQKKPDTKPETKVTKEREERKPYEQKPGNRGDSSNRSSDRDDRRGRFKSFFKKKVCRFCTKKLEIHFLDYEMLKRFTTDRGKILPSRITGTCAKHQRRLTKAIKRARVLAFLPFAGK